LPIDNKFLIDSDHHGLSIELKIFKHLAESRSGQKQRVNFVKRVTASGLTAAGRVGRETATSGPS
jgi:hypothetical protein